MIKEYIELKITEMGRNNLKGESSVFNQIEECFDSKNEVKESLQERYGHIPKGKNKIYIDDGAGNPFVIGFTHSFWNQDISHNSKKWFQTDWITITEVKRNERYVNL